MGVCGCAWGGCAWVDVSTYVWVGGWVGVRGDVHGGVAVRIVPLQGWVVGIHAHTCTLVASHYR